jgi:hypothetical protein
MSPSSHLTLRPSKSTGYPSLLENTLTRLTVYTASDLLANSLLADVPAISSPPSLPANSLPADSLLAVKCPIAVLPLTGLY